MRYSGAAIFGTIKTDKGISSPVLATTLIEATLKLCGVIVSAPKGAKVMSSCRDGLNCSTSASCCEIKER